MRPWFNCGDVHWGIALQVLQIRRQRLSLVHALQRHTEALSDLIYPSVGQHHMPVPSKTVVMVTKPVCNLSITFTLSCPHIWKLDLSVGKPQVHWHSDLSISDISALRAVLKFHTSNTYTSTVCVPQLLHCRRGKTVAMPVIERERQQLSEAQNHRQKIRSLSWCSHHLEMDLSAMTSITIKAKFIGRGCCVQFACSHLQFGESVLVSWQNHNEVKICWAENYESALDWTRNQCRIKNKYEHRALNIFCMQ